jgi:FkbM family methyltransferase
MFQHTIYKKALYKIINWYIKHFPFPHRGWKYFRSVLKFVGLLHKDYSKKLHNGYFMAVKPSEHIQQQIFWYGYYEKDAILTWEKFLHNKSVVLDIGANTGYYTITSAAVAQQVYAFEPSTREREMLTHNVERNGFRNVIIQPEAVSDECDQAHLYLSGPDNKGMSGLQTPDNFMGSIEIVVTITLDNWMLSTRPERIDGIKIDVEGAELKVLNGMKQLLLEHAPFIFIEIMSDLLKKFEAVPEDIYRFLEARGYKGYRIKAPGVLISVTSPEEDYNLVFLPNNATLPEGITLMERS